MNDNNIKNINIINTNLINNTHFKLDDRSGITCVRTEHLCLCQYMPNGNASVDAQIGDYLIEKITDSQLSSEIRNTALKTALLFQKKRLNTYFQIAKPKELSRLSNQISELEAIDKISKKLKIPFDLLLKDRETLKLIQANHLHYRIDNTYTERGFGPKIVNNQIVFPVNLGSSFNDNDVVWLPLANLPTNAKNTLLYNYGPFGFEPYRADQATELLPIKLQDRPKDAPATIRIELVTLPPTYDLTKISSSLGHGWIRVYMPQISDQKDTGKDFVYSIGYFLNLFTGGNRRLMTPDLREFMQDTNPISSQTEMSAETWQEVKSYIEKYMRMLRGESIPDQMEQRIMKKAMCGTCCNFSGEIFRKATGMGFDARHPIMRTIGKITQPIGAFAKRFVPEIISQAVSRLHNGHFPGTLVCQQQAYIKQLSAASN